MNLLYIAASCAPNSGSEDKIGWNVPLESAKQNRVFVITMERQRQRIEKYLSGHPQKNVTFYYVDIPEVFKRIFPAGFYSGRLNVWNEKAFKLAKEICIKESIDVIHQITPVEFRSIGKYGSIPGVKFVCGPVAGGQAIPEALCCYLSWKQREMECLRSVINDCCRILLKISGKLRKCHFLIYANQETKQYLASSGYSGQNGMLLTDVSVGKGELAAEKENGKQSTNKCRLLVAARLVYLKGHSLLLDALSQIPENIEYECVVIGQGPMDAYLTKKSAELGLSEKVSFCGMIPYEQMTNTYDKADVLVLPSFREATGTVILEAMARGLPVIAMNKFGGALLVNEETGWLYEGNSKEEYVENLKNALLECILNPQEVVRRGENARKRAEAYTWERRADEYQRIYERLTKSEK